MFMILIPIATTVWTGWTQTKLQEKIKIQSVADETQQDEEQRNYEDSGKQEAVRQSTQPRQQLLPEARWEACPEPSLRDAQ